MRESETTPAEAEPSAPVVRLRPIRTLVVSGDVDYKDRALSVVSELGPTAFAVGSLSVPEDVLNLAAAECADVVVLDASGCEHDAGAVISKLAECLPRVGVVVVCEHCSAAAVALDALPKWGWTQDLRAGIECAYREGNPLCPGLRAAMRRNDPRERRGVRPLTER
jgi:DNA-binding NarL/FixJ family response regulator